MITEIIMLIAAIIIGYSLIGNLKFIFFQDAAEKGDLYKVSKYLSNKPNNIDISDRNGFTALHLAIIKERYKVVEFLLSKGANINKKQEVFSMTKVVDGFTPLMLAIISSNYKIIDLLLSNNADPNISDDSGRTAIMYSISSKNLEICNKLIKCGSDLNIKDKDGQIPLDYAIAIENSEIVTLIKSNTSDMKSS